MTLKFVNLARSSSWLLHLKIFTKDKSYNRQYKICMSYMLLEGRYVCDCMVS